VFTPEFVNQELGEYVLVANHSLESHESASLSAAFNLARINSGQQHLPASIRRCRVIYDIRGQTVPESHIELVRSQLSLVCSLEFKR
jgi:hypothetical protein